jgi:short-subunit dehydrogenase
MSEANEASDWSPRRGSVLVVGVGASQGLGAAVARRFAGAGYPLLIAGRNAEKLRATRAELAGSGAVCSAEIAMRPR